MADPISAGIAAAVSGAAAIFSYNKEAFVFERTLKQSEAHQRQTMRVQEVALYREDIRDLFGVTVQKMDNYLIVNTLMLGFCISLLYAIDLQKGTPDWIHWMWTLSMSGAMLFLLLSIWLCLHASITAQSLVVRLLTQWLRLPVPNSSEIAQYAAKFQDYEKNANMLLRFPALGLSQRTPSVTIPEHGGRQDLSGNQLQKTHLHLFRQLARSWRGYDAYARVCMIMGTNQLLQALGHLSIAKMFLVNEDMFACLFVVITMHSLSLIHFKLNITPTRQQHTVMTFLLGAPPVTSFAAASLWYYNSRTAADIVAVFAVFIHLIWICFVLTLAIEDEGGMPKNFTQVGLSADIVGDDTFQDYLDDELEKINHREREQETASGAGGQDDTQTGTGESLPFSGEEEAVHRFHQLMRQWENVTGGTLALTTSEAIERKRKIAQRFDKLSRYVMNLHVPESPSEEIRVLMDLKWTKMNSSVLLNVDTGEMRAPVSQVESEGEEAEGWTKEERFAHQVRLFRDMDGHESQEIRSSSDEEEMHSLLRKKIGSGDIVINVDRDGSSNSLIFGDSQRTNQMLRKASTRPWSSYKQGSALLIFCWLIALVMALLIPFGLTWRNADYKGGARGALHHADIAGGIEAGVGASHLTAKLAAARF